MLSSRASTLPDSPRTVAQPAGAAPSQAAAARSLSLLTFEDELEPPDDGGSAGDSLHAFDWYSGPPSTGDDGPEPDSPGGEKGSCANRTDSPPGPGVEDPHSPLERGDQGPGVEQLQQRPRDRHRPSDLSP